MSTMVQKKHGAKKKKERNMLTLDNKRLAHQIDNQVDRLRKAGAL